MEIDRIAESLSRSEKTVLSQATSGPSYLSDIEIKTGLEKSAVYNAARKLSASGLVVMSSDAGVHYVLTALGKRYLERGLPEYVLARAALDNGKTDFKSLSAEGLDRDEISVAVGLLRKNKAINVAQDGAITIAKKDIKDLEMKNLILKSINDGSDVSGNAGLEDLIRRKIVEEIEEIHEKITITKDGIAVTLSPAFKAVLVDKLTPDVIRDWSKIKFREYSLDAEVPTPFYGKKHITKLFVDRIKDVMTVMGFEEMSGNYAESGFWNFDVMYFKQDHPDRDIQDTVYIDGYRPELPKVLLNEVKDVYENGFDGGKYSRSVGHGTEFDEEKSRILIMRGHTTATTFRYISDVISKDKDKPRKFFSVSKVFRNETPDMTHLPEFYQIEGVVYGDDLSVSDLIGYIKEFYSRLGINKIRLKPTYNPYTEPSLEVQAFSKKLNRWIEVGNSGVFRPETLAPFGIKKNVIAWGFGMERMLALRLGLPDIRAVYGAFSDLDLLREVEPRKLFGGFD